MPLQEDGAIYNSLFNKRDMKHEIGPSLIKSIPCVLYVTHCSVSLDNIRAPWSRASSHIRVAAQMTMSVSQNC